MPCAGYDRSCKSAFERFWIALREMIVHRRQRRALGELDDRLIRDVGLTKSEVERETKRSIWD